MAVLSLKISVDYCQLQMHRNMEISGLSDLCDDVEGDENGETELGLQASGEGKRSELVGRGGFCIDYASQQCYIWFHTR